MISIKNSVLTILVGLLCGTGYGQISSSAWSNFDLSSYDRSQSESDSDANFIFDRKYIEVVKGKKNNFFIFNTTHRKIQINSPFGIKTLNKLYIPIYGELSSEDSIISCRIQVLKKNGDVVETEFRNAMETTLPANYSSLYKIDGRVKLIAIENLSIGDQLEYIYKIRSKLRLGYSKLWYSGQEDFYSYFPCSEKSLFISEGKFNIGIYPKNFLSVNDNMDDMRFKTGYRFSVKDIDGVPPTFFNTTRYNPYVNFVISEESLEDKIDWNDITKSFKASTYSLKHSDWLEGEKISELTRKIEEKATIRDKIEYLQSKLNRDFENDSELYQYNRRNIYLAWSYASQISKILLSQSIKVDYHFVVDKNYGELNLNDKSIHQFDGIILSVMDEKGEKMYFSILEPFSKLNQVKSAYQGSDCLTISQHLDGTRSYKFETFPEISKQFDMSRRTLKLSLHDIQNNTRPMIKEELILYGNSYFDIRPELKFAQKELEESDYQLKKIIIENYLPAVKMDSLKFKTIEAFDDSIKLNYEYFITEYTVSDEDILKIKLQSFLQFEKNSPFNIDQYATEVGQFIKLSTDEILVQFIKPKKFSWIKNTAFGDSMENDMGFFKRTFDENDESLILQFSFGNLSKDIMSNDWINLFNLNSEYNYIRANSVYFNLN